ncbi:MAG: WGR domain-containing protein [Candidatus Paracaedimonas acanthamoebae]|uniref:WGR domain-containing protein n=1 Tax=Candidatus Paracaedimonas acanthamoebae TaxID=244581 RepID=A0A8J7PZ95_9PROT|nr:WGR domain-containing protein [Holosporales bacterium]MBN9412306.1 WGR domain-containing protein [Candidatus Paracaedimonas acanthamoebae]
MHAEFYLKAQNKGAGIFRYYHIVVMPTLFKDWSLLIANGRIGQKARQRSLLFTDLNLLIKKIKQILNKRLKAEKRLGCNYHLIDHTCDDEFKRQVIPHLSISLTSPC